MDDSTWMFTEGEGSTTEDSSGLVGEIHGAAWVMPDGTIIAQAMELENGEYYDGLSSSEGDTLLFFFEIPENTQYVEVNMYTWYYDYDEEDYEDPEYEIFISKDEIPSAGTTIMNSKPTMDCMFTNHLHNQKKVFIGLL